MSSLKHTDTHTCIKTQKHTQKHANTRTSTHVRTQAQAHTHTLCDKYIRVCTRLYMHKLQHKLSRIVEEMQITIHYHFNSERCFPCTNSRIQYNLNFYMYILKKEYMSMCVETLTVLHCEHGSGLRIERLVNVAAFSLVVVCILFLVI